MHGVLRLVVGPHGPHRTAVCAGCLEGLFPGVLVAFGLGIVDAFLNLRLSQLPLIVLRAAVAGAAGAVAGLFGGIIGQVLYWLIPLRAAGGAGSIMTGFLIGFGVGGFDLVERLVRREKPWAAVRNCCTASSAAQSAGCSAPASMWRCTWSEM